MLSSRLQGPCIAEFLQHGIKYIVVRHQIAALCTELITILSEGDNADHDVYRKDTWLVHLLNCHAKAIARDAKTDDDWQKIVRAMCRGKHDMQINMNDAARVVQHFSGGADAPCLKELQNFGNTLKSPPLMG